MTRRELVRIAAEIVPVVCVGVCLAASLVALLAALGRGRAPQHRPASEVAQIPAHLDDAIAAPPTVEPALEATQQSREASSILPVLALLCMSESREIAERTARLKGLEAQTARRTEEVQNLEGRAREARARTLSLQERAGLLEREARALRAQRELLLRDRETARRRLVEARSGSDRRFAVVPFRGPSGTWRVPIVVDCREHSVSLLPGGPSFGLMELSMGFGVRPNPLAALVRRKRDELEQRLGPDGVPSVPYILFLVRPDGIRAFYEARTALETLGIAFGYELIDQDWIVEAIDPDSESAGDTDEPPRLSTRDQLPPETAHTGRGGQPDPDDGLYLWPAGRSAQPGAGSEGGFDPGLGGKFGAHASGSLVPDPADRAVAEGEDSDAFRFEGLDLDKPEPRDEPHTHPELMGSTPTPASPSRVGQAGHGASPQPSLWTQQPPDGQATAGGAVDPDIHPWPTGAVASASQGRPRTAVNAPRNPGRAQQPDLAGSSSTAGAPSTPPAGVGLAGAITGPTPAGGWFDIVVTCSEDSVLIQPGGFQLSKQRIQSGTLLLDRLRALAWANTRSESGDPWLRPRLRFVVQPGGTDTFWHARRQTTFAGLEWPATLEVREGAGAGTGRLSTEGSRF